jgi:hypothetical protein
VGIPVTTMVYESEGIRIMKREDLKSGMIVRFQYELIFHKGQWMNYCGLVVGNDRNLRVHCFVNGHMGVFSKNGSIRNIQILPWELKCSADL